MRRVREEFDLRRKEVDNYFDFLRDFLRDDAKVVYPQRGVVRREISKEIHNDIKVTLKANAFLLLYNLVESTLEKAVRRVFEVLIEQNIKFTDARRELKLLWVRETLKVHWDSSLEKLTSEINDLAERVVSDNALSFDITRIRKLYQGNLSAEQFRDVVKKLGFKIKASSAAKGGDQLAVVAAKRNALAHGSESFKECGRDFTWDQLFEIKKQVIAYLSSVLKSFRKYLTTGQFAAINVR